MADKQEETKEKKTESLPKESVPPFINNMNGGEVKFEKFSINIYPPSTSVEKRNQNNFQERQDRNKNNKLIGNYLHQRNLYILMIVLIIILTFIWGFIYNNFQKQPDKLTTSRQDTKELDKTPNNPIKLSTTSQLTNDTVFSLIYTLIWKNVEELKKRAFFLVLKIVGDKHDAKAQYELGRMYETGTGVAQNFQEAKKYYNNASEKGYPEAQLALAKIHTDQKKAQDLYKKALKGFLKLANQGDVESQIYLWYMYRNGLGIEKDVQKAIYWYAKALKYFEKCYEQDCESAQFYLDTVIKRINMSDDDKRKDSNTSLEDGDRYYYGINRMRNLKIAKYYYEEASKYNEKAQFKLAYMNEKGLGGVKNLEQAKKLYKNAYKTLESKEDITSQIYLWYIYANGLGVTQNEKKAEEYKKKAIMQDPSEVDKIINNLNNPPEQDFSNTKMRYMYLNLGEDEFEDLKKMEFFLVGKYEGYTKAKCDLWYMYANGLGVQQDNTKANKWLEEAQTMHPNLKKIQLYLGYITLNNPKVSKNSESKDYSQDPNYKEALKTFKKLAEQGNMKANLYLAYMYKNGLGIEKNENEKTKFYEKSFNLFQNLAIQGYENIQNELKKNINANKEEDEKNIIWNFYLFLVDLGDMYKDREQCEDQENNLYKDQADNLYKLVINYFQESKDQFSGKVDFYLGMMYQNGKGVSKNLEQAIYHFEKAKNYFEKAAEQGNAEAQLKLGDMYYNGLGVAKELLDSQFWYEQATKQGNAEAQLKLGDMYYNGLGVAKNLEQAKYYFEQAAKQGNAEAQLKLGDIYYNGLGVAKNLEQAKYYFEQAAGKGHSEALYKLGCIYKDKDSKQAKYWYEKAAGKGHSKALYELGNIYGNISKN